MGNKRKFLIAILIGLSFIFVGVGLELSKPVTNNSIESQVIHYFTSNDENSTYLSDIEYIANQSYARYDKIRYDEVNGGSKISVRIENNIFTFDKGIWAHATSQVTYDISNYDYKYFTAFVGLNTTSTRGDGVRFYIYTSEDGQDWGEAKYDEVKTPGKNATFVKVDIKGAKYIRLIANQIANNASDHAVYADAKLTNSANQSSAFKSVDEYNEIIKSQNNNQTDITGDLEFNVLKKELVQNVGEYTINSFYNESNDNKAMIDWLMSNQKALKYYILGGKPTGTYYNSLTQLSRLYKNYKGDFDNTEVTKYGNSLGDLYLRMAVSLSLTHSHRVGLWINNAANDYNQSDSVRRYAIYRYMHKNGLLKGVNGADLAEWFEDYSVEEMRFVMATSIDDEEILWLNAYTQERIDKSGGSYLTPHPYIAYVTPNDDNPVFYAEENKDYFNDLFSVLDPNNAGQRIGLWDLEYTIPGGVDVPEYNIKIQRGNRVYKLWIVMRNKFGTGVVCGGISKTGTTIKGVHGIPAAVVGQPGHAAYIYYSRNTNGEGYWSLDNDVSGWAYSGAGSAGGAIPGAGRGLLGYSTGPYAKGDTGSYVALAQEVINHKDTYEQSQKLIYLASAYSDSAKKEELYRKALEIQPLNLDAWYELIQVYNASSNKTEDDYYELAKEIAENLKYYPLPMYQMTNLIKPKLTSIESSYKFTLLQTRILKEASATPNGSTKVLQPSLTRLMANFLLGQMDTTIATFSFDGEDENTIVLSDRFDGNGLRWDYSLDGKKTWKEVAFTAEEEHKHKLTKEEIESITAENDIYIHIVGVNYDEENLYKIDISESAGLPSNLFVNDLENKILGVTNSVEWKYEENDNWTKYGSKQPDLTGDKSVIVRMGATKTFLASKTSSTYTFTEDIVDPKRKYISVSHISLEAVSTEATSQQGSAAFAIDGNYNTRWHSAWNGSDTERYITVKLDQPYNISSVEFVPAAGGNGKIYDGTVWGSMDGENWMVLSQKKGLTYTNQATTVEQAIANIKDFDIENPQRVQYVKIVADRTNGNWITARAFNFYEDTTIKNVATFSFDGANAGTISLFDEFKNKNWKYSIDGGTTWEKVTTANHKLSSKELEKINSTNKIEIVIDGDNTEYSINIKKGDTPEKGYLNDLENRPIAQPDQENLEWKISGDDSWTSYKDEEPNVKGDKTLLVRRKATGITTASDSIEYKFTADNQPTNRKYISIKHLGIQAFSTQSVDATRPFYAVNAIDGNFNTIWHTDFRYSVLSQGTKPFLTIKLDEPKYISSLEFIQKKYRSDDPDFIKNATVFVSMDNENWTEAGKIENCSQEEQVLRKIDFDKSVQAQYVKLEMETYGIFASIAMVNLYEDKTKTPTITPTVNVEYSTTELTNGDVVATLVSNNANITITNNEGKNTYTFTKNGTFTFEFVDEDGNEGTAVASVKNIDKTAPIGTIEYSILDVTNENVVVTLNANEEIIVTNNNGKNTYTFTENGTFTFEFVDKAGNKGTATAQVTWINKNAPVGTITYDISELTNKDVVATLKVDKGVIITNNGGKNTYTFTKNGTFTFEFVDTAGNRATATATVNWIDKVAPTAKIEYSTTELTNKDVTAILKDFSEEIEILNNDGKAEYTFTKNGTFTFEFVDKAGNEGSAKAVVNNIVKVVPTAKVEYSTVDPTNKDVVAKITGLTDGIVITNNNGSDTYTFTDNGTFTFEFRDKAGNEGSVVAVVNNIDRIAPKATITYNPLTLTKQNVIATIGNFSEDVTILNNNGSSMYTFVKNGSFKFKISDKAGNISYIEAKVDWIYDGSANGKPNTGITNSGKPSFPNVIMNKAPVVIDNSNSSSSNSSKNEETKPANDDSNNDSYTLFEVQGVTLKVPNGLWTAGTELKIKYLQLSSTIQDKFGNAEDYFELYIEPKQVDNLVSKSITMIVDLDSSMEFDGIYKVNGEKFEKLDYKDLGNNKIEVKVDGLGKYLIDYKENKKDSNKNIVNESGSIYLSLIIWSGIIALLVVGVTFWLKRRA